MLVYHIILMQKSNPLPLCFLFENIIKFSQYAAYFYIILIQFHPAALNPRHVKHIVNDR